MTEEAVEPQIEQPSEVQVAEEVVETMQQEVAEEQPQVEEQEAEKSQVPLSALQKERKKRQDLEMQIEWERQQRQPPQQPAEDDMSRYESATKEDLSKSQEQAVRIVEEKIWSRTNPDKYERVNEYLPEFLKQRPNLAYAINSASNRYEEAWTLMEALSPKQQKQLKAQSASPKKEAPGSPNGIPKAAAINQAIDVMSMNDQEFSEWRKGQRRKR